MIPLHSERTTAIWCAILCVACIAIAQLVVPVSRTPAERPCECTCLPPGDYDAALFCTGAVNVRLRPKTEEMK